MQRLRLSNSQSRRRRLSSVSSRLSIKSISCFRRILEPHPELDAFPRRSSLEFDGFEPLRQGPSSWKPCKESSRVENFQNPLGDLQNRRTASLMSSVRSTRTRFRQSFL